MRMAGLLFPPTGTQHELFFLPYSLFSVKVYRLYRPLDRFGGRKWQWQGEGVVVVVAALGSCIQVRSKT
jgi:hypothetical protein